MAREISLSEAVVLQCSQLLRSAMDPSELTGLTQKSLQSCTEKVSLGPCVVGKRNTYVVRVGYSIFCLEEFVGSPCDIASDMCARVYHCNVFRRLCVRSCVGGTAEFPV